VVSDAGAFALLRYFWDDCCALIHPTQGGLMPKTTTAVVVFDIESDDGPTPLGVYIGAGEDSVYYRAPDGGARSAPADCVTVREVDVYAASERPDRYSAQALRAVTIDDDEPEPIGGPIASYAEVAALQAAIEALRAIEKRAGSQSWKAPRTASASEPTGFALGRCAEACDRALWGVENALTTIEVYAHDKASKALTKAREQAREARDDA
jgi:hypothetical protein